MKKEIKITIKSLFIILILFSIVFISVWSRLGTLKAETILDYDPWWFYRYTKDILENNLIPPSWDLLSFFPPGRPIYSYLGWEYTMILFFKISSLFSPGISLMTVAKLSPAIMVGLTAVVAFFLGRHLSNDWGGLATALFSTLSLTFIGVSMAGYCDSDAVVVFYSFLTILTVFFAMRKKTVPYIIISILSVLIFMFNWMASWYILFFFILFIPGFIIFRLLENMIHKKQLKFNLWEILRESKPLFAPLVIILVVTNLVGTILGIGNVYDFLMTGLGFIGAEQIVNVSVAELQPINIFTREGFLAVASRVGLVPLVITILGLPILALYKIYKKMKISPSEVFLFLWIITTFYLILHGVRFSLLFSCAVATSAGYVVGNLVKLFGKNIIVNSAISGIVLLLIVMFVSDSLSYTTSASGMEVSKNWINMLDWLKSNADPKATVATWWDPGHIIAGYTGLRVHADGAHCSPKGCVPYPHNTRIQNMGKIMSTSDEDEAVDILQKYLGLTPEQCQEVKQKFGNKVPDEACEPASEMYFISSNDLIGKFTWMNYFGGYRASIASNYDFARNPGVCCASTPKTESGQISCGEFANQGKGVWIWCPWIFSLKDMKQDQDGNPVYVYDYSGLTITLIQKNDRLIPIYNNQFVINHMTFFFQGQRQDQDLSGLNTTLEKIDGLIWLDPGFRSLIYFAPAIKDSIFTRTFFYDGEGLKHFELVYSNPEIKLYKVIF